MVQREREPELRQIQQHELMAQEKIRNQPLQVEATGPTQPQPTLVSADSQIQHTAATQHTPYPQSAAQQQVSTTPSPEPVHQDHKSHTTFGSKAKLVGQQHQPITGPKTKRATTVPLPANARTHFFLSHCQSTGGDQTNAIYLELERIGFSCWYDNRASDLTKEGMRQGIVNTAAFLLFLSEGALERPFVQFEVREVTALKKPMVLVHESDPRFGTFDFRSARDKAPQQTCRTCSTTTSRCRSAGGAMSATACSRT
jgi:hypothetical protein